MLNAAGEGDRHRGDERLADLQLDLRVGVQRDVAWVALIPLAVVDSDDRTGDSMWMTPSGAWACSQYRHGPFWAWAGIPMSAGTWRADPFTKMVRWAWMWKMLCSLAWQLIPSTSWPVASVAMLASGAALGTGTPSGPDGPAGGAGVSLPSVLSAASLSFGVPPAGALPPGVTTRAMPTATMATAAATPIPAIQLRRRLRRASRARIWAIFCRACCLFLLPLDTCAYPLIRPVT